MSNILIIEDEKNLARFVELELKHEGYNTEVHYNGRVRSLPPRASIEEHPDHHDDRERFCD